MQPHGFSSLVGDAALAAGGSRGIDRGDRTRRRLLAILGALEIPRLKARGAGRIVNAGSATALAPARPYGWLAECPLQLCQLPAAERTGLATHGAHFRVAMGLRVLCADATREMPPAAPPAASHPAIGAGGG